MNFLLTIVIFIILIIHISIGQILNPTHESDDENPYLAPDNIYMERVKNSHLTSSKSSKKNKRKPSWKKRLSRYSNKRRSSKNDVYENSDQEMSNSFSRYSNKRRPSKNDVYENSDQEMSNSLSRSSLKSSNKYKDKEKINAKGGDKENQPHRKSLRRRLLSRFSRNQSSKNSIYENTSGHGGRGSFYRRLRSRFSSKKKNNNVYEIPDDKIRRPSLTSSRRHSEDDEGYLVDPAKENSFRRQNTKTKPVLYRPERRGSSVYGQLGIGKPKFYERYDGFNIEPFLSKHKFSIFIYKKVWSSCDYKCFYEKGYERFKIRVYLQLNLLRKYHYAQPLTQNSLLNRLAQQHADKMARRRSLIRFDSILYGATLGATYYPAASTIVTRWYDEYTNYSFILSQKRPGSQQLTQILWKDSKEVGIGAARGDNFLYLVCLYWPKGNINGLYKKNVLSRQKNWRE